MGNKKRGSHILQKDSGYHITLECSVCRVERNQLHVKSCKCVDPSLELCYVGSYATSYLHINYETISIT